MAMNKGVYLAINLCYLSDSFLGNFLAAREWPAKPLDSVQL